METSLHVLQALPSSTEIFNQKIKSAIGNHTDTPPTGITGSPQGG